MTPRLTDPAGPAPRSAPPPFWAVLIDDPTAQATPVADLAAPPTAPLHEADMSDPHRRNSSADNANAAATPHTSPQQADVVFADLTDTDIDTDTDGASVDGRLGMIAAGVLRGGGILAVLTRCHHDADGALVDMTGGIVASGQNADLLYLQHIVIPDQPLRPPHPTGAAAARADRDPPTTDAAHAVLHQVAHADLLVFARPRTANTHLQPGPAAAGDTTAGLPSSVPVTAASSGIRR